ncbi:MAG: hypothetical protein ACYSU0_15080 [Planctomycetota bacterium]
MDSLGLKCQRCSEGATVHMTETTGGKVRESHFCEKHARGLCVSLPTPWPDDDLHTTLEVTAEQLRRPENVVVRFADGFETNLRDLWDVFTDGHQEMICRSPDGSDTRVRDWGELLRGPISAVVDIPQEGAGEPRQVRIDSVPEAPKEGSRPAGATDAAGP